MTEPNKRENALGTATDKALQSTPEQTVEEYRRIIAHALADYRAELLAPFEEALAFAESQDCYESGLIADHIRDAIRRAKEGTT